MISLLIKKFKLPCSTIGDAPQFVNAALDKPRQYCGKGNDAAHLRETDESLMHRGHDLWLATLKWMSEGK
jgi:hypothetical protein